MRKVALIGADTLRTKCPERSIKEINDFLTEELEVPLDAVLNDMNETMIAEHGMGLAANQVGLPLRIFILKDLSEQGYREYVNPEILTQEELVDFENEGCLSVPGVSAKTKRFRKLKLRWQDRRGTTYDGDFEDLQAFACQHEIDHLNGKLYVDQLGYVTRSLLLKDHKKYLSGRRR